MCAVMLETVDERWAEKIERAAEGYAREAFDIDLALEPLPLSALPYYIADRYRLWRGEMFGRAWIFMAVRSTDSPDGPAELARHREVVFRQWPGDLVILLFEALTPRRRKRLIADRFAFMVPGAQLFIPELLLEFRERGAKAPVARAPERFSPTAQLVTVAALLRQEIEGANATTLARRFGVAVMSMGRAFDELQAAGVVDAGRVGRDRSLHMKAEGRALWQVVERQLQSPVRKVRRIAIPYPERFPGLVAGESALALYTALASPRTQTLAVAGADWNRLVREHGLRDLELGDDGDDVQTWTYDPAALADRDVVDRLSLYLSVRDHGDERVSQAAEQLLESLPW
ncbi:MAG: hypothetical protein ACYDD1_00915 [Caulobacteraceae bacterium]